MSHVQLSSRNCTKHNVRCDYMETAMAEGVPDLCITPQIQRELDTWRHTTAFPFPSLGLEHPPSPSLYGANDLRLVHHIASIANDMQVVDASSRYALWTRRIPMYDHVSILYTVIIHCS